MNFLALQSRSLIRGSIAALALIALASCGGGGGASGTNTSPGTATTTLAGAQELVNTFAATLTGPEETPPTPSAAQGSGTIVVNPGTRVAVATVTTSGIAGTAAHIHAGASGVAGPIIFPLTETAPGSGIWVAKIVLTDAQLSVLQAGNYYFDVHSASFPNGEIRGQILSQQAGAATGATANGSSGSALNAASSSNTFVSALRGSQETPANASAAQGSGAAVVNPLSRSLLAAVTTTGIAGTAAHIHIGAVGVAGPIIIALSEAPAGSGTWIAQATLTVEQFNALVAGNLYFNVHSAAFPNGEIRGQILPLQQSINASSLIVPDNTSNLTGTGITGTGITGIGITGIGITGTGITGTGITGIGTTGSNITGTDLTGIGTVGTGTTGTGIGVTGTGITGTNTLGTDLTGTGITGGGTTGTGLTGTTTTGTGLTGTGTTGASLTGIGATGM